MHCAGAATATFQAGHASSILVPRSTSSLLVKLTLSMSKLFELVDEKIAM